MKLKKIIIYISLFVFILTIGRFIQKYIDSQFYGERLPFLQMVGTNQATIKWQSLTEHQATVFYGTNPNKLIMSSSDNTTCLEHKITLTNLKQDTQYWYRINKTTYTFFTAPNKNTKRDLLFWVLGDPGKPTNALKKTYAIGTQWLAHKQLDLLLTTGDNAYTSGRNIEYQKSIFNIFGNTLTSTSFYPAYGNHDARRFAFFKIFSFPQNAELGGIASHTDEYFSFDYGSVHFVFLNSETNPLLSQDTMLNWLQQDLSNNTNRWTIVIFHSPPYTKGSHDSDSLRDSWGRMTIMRTSVIPILEQYDTDLVLTGHSHAYERSHLLHCHYDKSPTFNKAMILDDDGIYQKNPNKTPLDGTIYVVLGSSSKVDKGKFNHPALPIHLAKTGSLMLSVNQSHLTGYFIDTNGLVLDNFIIDKTNKIQRQTPKDCHN